MVLTFWTSNHGGTVYLVQVWEQHDPDPRRSMPLPHPPGSVPIGNVRGLNDREPSKTVRMIEIAEFLGVSKQRAHQLATEDDFPAPVAEDGRGRLWDRRDVTAWAKVWRQEKPWR